MSAALTTATTASASAPARMERRMRKPPKEMRHRTTPAIVPRDRSGRSGRSVGSTRSAGSLRSGRSLSSRGAGRLAGARQQLDLSALHLLLEHTEPRPLTEVQHLIERVVGLAQFSGA